VAGEGGQPLPLCRFRFCFTNLLVWRDVWKSGYQMPANLAIDDRLIEQAQKLVRHQTKKDTMNAPREEYIRRGKQVRLSGCSARSTTTRLRDAEMFAVRATSRCCWRLC